MNKEIMKKFGFGEEVEFVNRGYCPFCFKEVKTQDFKDKKSLDEFRISGYCKKCQDKFFEE